VPVALEVIRTAGPGLDGNQTTVLYICSYPGHARGGRDSHEGFLMARKTLLALLLLVAVGGAVAYALFGRGPGSLVLTGIVTTHDVIVGPQVGGQVERLLVKEGDTVKAGELVAVIAPAELRADSAYYAHSAAGVDAQVREGEVALRLQELQTAQEIKQAQATLAAAEAQQAQAEATLENARVTLKRTEQLYHQALSPAQDYDQARTTEQAAAAAVDALKKQADAARAALALAQSNAEQIAIKRSQLHANQQQLAAADAQRTKADVILGYTEVHAPIDGIVDVRAVRQGEVVAVGQPILTLINPDDLWVRADVEETYIDRVRLGDTMTVRLPSGDERQGTVFYRGVDAGFATQRDVSRTKRDIKTFEIRLRVDNRDRRLAVGMTAYVLFPLAPRPADAK
jgi:HlyD family secretion protein